MVGFLFCSKGHSGGFAAKARNVAFGVNDASRLRLSECQGWEQSCIQCTAPSEEGSR